MITEKKQKKTLNPATTMTTLKTITKTSEKHDLQQKEYTIKQQKKAQNNIKELMIPCGKNIFRL